MILEVQLITDILDFAALFAFSFISILVGVSFIRWCAISERTNDWTIPFRGWVVIVAMCCVWSLAMWWLRLP